MGKCKRNDEPNSIVSIFSCCFSQAWNFSHIRSKIQVYCAQLHEQKQIQKFKLNLSSFQNFFYWIEIATSVCKNYTFYKNIIVFCSYRIGNTNRYEVLIWRHEASGYIFHHISFATNHKLRNWFCTLLFSLNCKSSISLYQW